MVFVTAGNFILITNQLVTNGAVFKGYYIAYTEVYLRIAATYQRRYADGKADRHATADIYITRRIKLRSMRKGQRRSKIVVVGSCVTKIAKVAAVLVTHKTVLIVWFHIEIHQFGPYTFYFFGRG